MTIPTTALRQALAHWSAEMDRAASAAESEALPFAIIDGNRAVASVLRDAGASLDELDQLRAEVARLRDIAGRLSTWTVTCGRALCPPLGSADTFGDGMREAQRQVSNILADKRHGWKAGAAEPPRDASAGEGAR